MSEDSFTEISSQSWFSRIGGSFKGIILGVILVVAAFPVLFWNEGRSVARYNDLKEGEGVVESIPAAPVDFRNTRKLVHVTGFADTDSTLVDPIFGVTAKAIKLSREVEMYQWREEVREQTKKKLGGGTETTKTYSYTKGWSDQRIDSSRFKKPEGHENPDAMPHKAKSWTADPVTLGDFRLSHGLVDKIQSYEPISMQNVVLPDSLTGKATIQESGYYIGTDSIAPQIGDLRVNFEVVLPTDVSLVAKQVDNTFDKYVASSGGTIELLQTGTHSPESLFASANANNRFLTWMLRAVGFAMMLFGFLTFLKPLSVLGDVIPILGDILGFGSAVVAFILAATLSLTTIAVAWIAHRPFMAIGLLLLAGGCVALFKYLPRGSKEAEPSAEREPVEA